ncbi:hypothetical protein [Amycolatopsis minnesotensis]|uniref:Uncharacterized protein n=1 Tax=Amycolatopsis minnesotensis TaxID=337894 RepID=A0ABP5DZN2_9PSEU
MREKVSTSERQATSPGSGEPTRPRRGARFVRAACGFAALSAGLWVSLQFAVIAAELPIPESVPPWDRLRDAQRPLATALLYGVLAVGGFRSIMRWRPWSWWLAGALPLPVWGAGAVLGWF